ncbi:MAG: hypothetical protein DWQ05_14420 [Calditrichaeota bacterium]|nr:MAG: hypothetical protein DWQ05_14420 [Calditrichota bacterium]
MNKRHFLYFAMAFLIAGCTTDNKDDPNLSSLLPEISGWQLADSPITYTHDTLFDYINGNCELYFPYGFEKLLSTSYENSANSEQTLIIDIYDMGSSLGAFGVYSSMSHPDYNYGDTGCESILSQQQVRFWQDSYQVEINCPTPFDGAEKLMQDAAAALSENFPACKKPEHFSWLPQENMIPHSIKYIADGFLGLSDFPGGMEAVYSIDGKEARGFAIKCQNPDEAQNSLTRYRDSQKAFKGAELQDQGTYFSSFHKYSGHVWAGVEGNWLYGSIAKDQLEISEQVATTIKNNLLSLQNQ